MTAKEIYNIHPAYSYCWRVLPNGNHVRLGNHVTLGTDVKLGDHVILGDHVTIGNNVVVGDNVTLGNLVTIGNDVMLGNSVTLRESILIGDRAMLGNNVTSDELNMVAIGEYAKASESHVFVKWVTQNRKSPIFNGNTVLEYPKGSVIKTTGEVSDQLSAAGIHIVRVGVRPEDIGMCEVGHDLIPLLVRVKSEDILYAGMPGNRDKLRVRQLEVLT